MLHDPYFDDPKYVAAIQREEERLRLIDLRTATRADLDRIGLDRVQDFAMEENARWEREKSDKQYDLDHSYEEEELL